MRILLQRSDCSVRASAAVSSRENAAAAPYRSQIWRLFGSALHKVKHRMTYFGPGVAAIALGASFAVGSAQAQNQTESPERTLWDHNGSVMYLTADGASREFYYQKPRPGMLDAGVRPGSLLFRGHVDGRQYLGTAYIFNPHCGPIPFEVKGESLDDDERIVLTGPAPRVGRNCRPYGSYTSSLEFRRAKPQDANRSQEALTAPLPRAIAANPELKPDVSSTQGNEVPSAPSAQRRARSETPSAANDSSASLVDSKPTTSAAQTFVPNETRATKGLEKYLWGAAFVVMIVWLLIKLFGKMLIGMK